MRSTIRWRCLAAGAILAACPRVGLTPVGQEPVDSTYKAIVFDKRSNVDPFQIYVFVKAVPQQDRLRVCAAYVAEMSDPRFDRFISALRNPSSYLRIGAKDGGYHMRTSFMSGTRTLVESTPWGE